MAFKFDKQEHDEDLELISELIEATLQEDGYTVQRFEETEHSTTEYRGLFVTDRNGRVFTVGLNRKWKD